MSITFARFNSHAAARAASKLLHQQLGHSGRVTLLSGAQRLSDPTLPLCMTGAGSGALFGGVFAGLISAVAIAAFLLLGMPGGPVLAPVATIAVCVGFSTLLGCLGGALCFATNTTGTVGLLREWLREGRPVVLVETDGGHEHDMQQLGAELIGKLG
jgi:hypothetical protein